MKGDKPAKYKKTPVLNPLGQYKRAKWGYTIGQSGTYNLSGYL
jgi:hypothetical protein